MSRWGRRPTSADQGSATLLTVSLAAILLTVGLVGSGIAQWAVAAERLRAAADLSAIAGAQVPARGCVRAAQLAEANQAQLVACQVDGTDVTVTVEAPAPTFAAQVARLLGQQASRLRMSARAGQQQVEQSDGP